jgi:guanosine-3',5'-bis(diphosphate) 3'-pyrophosphohydrolase
LHDVVEDTSLELSDINRDFGPKVMKIIDGLTKISGVFDNRSSLQAENFRKMILTLSDDVRVILIKLADRLHNMRTLDSMPRDKQLKIASETIFLYAPLAHRLGLYAIKSELEDLHLKYTDTESYNEIAQKLKSSKASRDKFIGEFIAPIQDSLNKAGLKCVIKGRPKSIHSIHNKMQKQGISFEQIYDLFAIRIIIDSEYENEKADCWKAYSVVTDFYKPSPERLKDWISTPKANGYESLHTTVMSSLGQWVEVQIRTKRMDDIAEKGYAAHWKYKESSPGNIKENGLESWIRKIRELIDNNDYSALEFVADFKQNLYNEEVFAFTPKGKLVTLPHGATALDFAFEIHTEVGAHCLGAKVNQKLVPLSYKLHNGDQVEVLTSAKQKPSEDWLKFVVSSKARARIKDYIKEEKKKVGAIGKEVVERKLKQLKKDFNAENLQILMRYFNAKNPVELFLDVAKELIDHKDIKRAFDEVEVPELKIDKSAIPATNASPDKTLQKIQDTGGLVIGDNLSSVEYSYAKCCNPIKGDDIFGFVSVSEGVKIHRTTCPNAVELMSHYGYRVIKARWASDIELPFQSGIYFKGADRIGIVNDVTKLISNELKVNIRSISINTNDGVFEGKILVDVQDSRQFDRLCMKMKAIPDIITVSRII